MRVVAHALDRARLLANGEMCMPVYSSRDVTEVARGAYQCMQDAARCMDLVLSEPVLESGRPDCWGGRIVTVRAGVFDGLL